METSGLHADIDSPLVWAAHPVRLLQAALQKPQAGGWRPADQHREERLSWPRRWRSGAAPSHR
eukprot:3073725-Prymnesium_polylepis.1